nr:hypothetical protein [Tanacetum cinerariifolium]
MPYYPNFQPQYSSQEEQMLFSQNEPIFSTTIKPSYRFPTTIQPTNPLTYLMKPKTRMKRSRSRRRRRRAVAKFECEDSEHFGDDALPRPPGLQRLGKSQRSGSTASSSSNLIVYQEFMAKQYELDHKAKMHVIEQETEDRMRLIQSQRIVEDMKVLQIDTREMDPADAAIINA